MPTSPSLRLRRRAWLIALAALCTAAIVVEVYLTRSEDPSPRYDDRALRQFEDAAVAAARAARAEAEAVPLDSLLSASTAAVERAEQRVARSQRALDSLLAAQARRARTLSPDARARAVDSAFTARSR